ncbi:helix-hairpin-helix domain-containing protein [bacterium]|nr:helix-hairpin-helix domain-containing protein [bacterium]
MRILTIILMLILPIIVFAKAKIVKNIENPTVTIHIIDVGQGDGILIQDHSSKKIVVVDAGKGDSTIIKYLKAKKIDEVNLFISTHAHSDHIGSAKKLLEEIKVKRVLDSGYAHSSTMYKKYLDLILDKNIPYSIAKSGQNINISNGKKIRVLAPPQTLFSGTRSDANSNSVVFQLVVDDATFYFSGDSEAETEEFVTREHSDIRSDVLKIAHHGGRHSTTDDFLSRVNPQIAVISVAKKNVYGHPSKEVIEKLKDKNIPTYLTSESGTIVIDTDGKNIAIHTEKSSDNSSASIVESKESEDSERDEYNFIKEFDPDNFRDAAKNGIPADLNSGEAVLKKDRYYSSRKSKEFFSFDCDALLAINARDLIEFLSYNDAVQSGRVLASTCKGAPEIDDCGNPIRKNSKKCLTSTTNINTDVKVNINTATIKELTKIKGVGESTAKKIIDYREKNGNFRKIEDITKVKGIGKKSFEKMRDFITI